MKVIAKSVCVLLLSSTSAFAGGFELQTLNTASLYEEGNYGAFSFAKINSDLNGVGANTQKVKTLKDQSVANGELKFETGKLDIGLVSFRSGAIQMSGDSDATFVGSYAPSVNANLNTLALIAKYSIGQNIDVLGGIQQNTLNDFNLTSVFGSYDISSKSNISYIAGAAYSIPDIALRAEILVQPGSEISTSGNYTSSAITVPGLGAIPAGVPGAVQAKLKTPQTITFNFQTGIAANTLIMGSIHHAKWGAAQTTATVATPSPAINGAAAVTSAFGDTTKYTIGLGRKFSDKVSGSLSYTHEAGSGATSKSVFTMSNGSRALSVGMKYSLENFDVSFGASRTMFGDVTVNPGSGQPDLVYSGNTATTFGLKLSTKF